MEKEEEEEKEEEKKEEDGLYGTLEGLGLRRGMEGVCGCLPYCYSNEQDNNRQVDGNREKSFLLWVFPREIIHLYCLLPQNGSAVVSTGGRVLLNSNNSWAFRLNSYWKYFKIPQGLAWNFHFPCPLFEC
jgi:hypothetical protein